MYLYCGIPEFAPLAAYDVTVHFTVCLPFIVPSLSATSFHERFSSTCCVSPWSSFPFFNLGIAAYSFSFPVPRFFFFSQLP